MRNRGVTKKSRDYWVATNFNENFVQWNSPQNAYFPCYAHWGLHVFQHCSSGGGHKIFDHQIGGVTKILPRYFRKFMTPLSQRKWWPPYRNACDGPAANSVLPCNHPASLPIVADCRELNSTQEQCHFALDLKWQRRLRLQLWNCQRSSQSGTAK